MMILHNFFPQQKAWYPYNVDFMHFVILSDYSFPKLYQLMLTFLLFLIEEPPHRTTYLHCELIDFKLPILGT